MTPLIRNGDLATRKIVEKYKANRSRLPYISLGAAVKNTEEFFPELAD
jgi:hypothetical protein